MGLIRAAVGAVGGTLSDSWLDYIRAENMTPTTILTKGEQVGKQHRRGSADIISNGSRIEVGANQMIFLTEGGNLHLCSPALSLPQPLAGAGGQPGAGCQGCGHRAWPSWNG